MEMDWSATFADVARRLPATAASAPPVFCGNGACIDARVSLHEAGPLFAATDPEAARFAALLRERVALGRGGEVTYHWPGGPGWIAARIPVRRVMGGTGPHAAWALSTLGARALLALEDRSPTMLELVPPNILLAEGDALVPAGAARPSGAARPPVFIFEYTAGEPVADLVPPRSSRIIVKFAHFRLEHDDAFARYTTAAASQAGAGLVSGFSSVAAADLPAETARVGDLARAWRRGGLETIHLELAGFDTPDTVWTLLAGLRNGITSVGMSLSELLAIAGGGDIVAAMRGVAEEAGLERLCVHADDWAAAVTTRDPGVEREALVTGCLVAASRAAAGTPVMPTGIPDGASFAPLPVPAEAAAGRHRFVACASPYLRSPRTTLGLGDTFTGGCLLALSAATARGRAG